MAVALFTPDDVRRAIRFDPLTKKGSVIDVIQLVTGHDAKQASNTFANLQVTFPDVSQMVGHFKFPGRGQRPTPVAHLKDLIEIAWLCPGRNAAEFRRTGAVTLCRALGGDPALVDEVCQRHRNLSMDEKEAILAGTGAEPSAHALAPLNPEEQRALKLRNEREALDVVRHAGETAELIKAWAERETDARQRVLLEDSARNMLNRYIALVTGGEVAEGEVRLPLTLSGVAAELGHKKLGQGELAAIGKVAARLYREAHGEAPPKHVQYVDGAARQVNSYTTEDRDILEEAVRAVLEGA